MFYSPLRYPGGKKRLANFIGQVCIDNDINGHYVEPYAGGASVALFLLIEKKVEKITINDFDKSIYAFWYSVLYYTDDFCNLINKTKITIPNWKKAKKIQKNKEKVNLEDKNDILKLGFSTFFLNRTNRSGIINAGVIGGIEQKGNYKIDCRFNKKDLIERIKLIAEHKENINLENLDAIDLIKKIKKENNKNCIFYFDPPYYIHGPELYLNSYQDDDHKKVSEEIKKVKNIHWIVSYDNTDKINELYNWANKKIEFTLTHSINKSRKGKEILFFSKNLKNINLQFIEKYI